MTTLFSWRFQDLCWLIFASITNWRVMLVSIPEFWVIPPVSQHWPPSKILQYVFDGFQPQLLNLLLVHAWVVEILGHPVRLPLAVKGLHHVPRSFVDLLWVWCERWDSTPVIRDDLRWKNMVRKTITWTQSSSRRLLRFIKDTWKQFSQRYIIPWGGHYIRFFEVFRLWLEENLKHNIKAEETPKWLTRTMAS